MSEEQNTVTAPERAKPRDVTPLQKLLGRLVLAAS